MIGAAVVTGAASGIGAALARRLAADGARVLVGDIDLSGAQATVDAIREAGGDALAAFADHADPASIAAFADLAFHDLPAIDLVIANAGVGAGGPLYSTPQRNVDWVLAVNVNGPIAMAQGFCPRLIAAGRPARFALTASEHALGLPLRGGQASIYTVSKHAALGVAETLRRDLAGTPVRVSVICPGMVVSEIWNPLRTRHDRFGGPRELPAQHAAENRAGLPAEIAAARILDGFAADEFFVLTHGQEVAEVAQARWDDFAAARARFAARYGQDA
jgi:NAD(P)-dependent dehydrogenase (short-subunit alcohol dehydrogenase family)